MKRRWFQVRLGTILMITTLACIVLAVRQGYVVPFGQQWESRKQLEKLGASMQLEPGRPAWLRPLVGEDKFQTVTMVHLEHRGVKSDQLKSLAALPGLQRLYLAGNPVDGGGLDSIRQLTGIRRLSLWNTRLNDQGVEHLAGLKQLQALDIHRTKITDRAVQHLVGLTRLRFLSIGSNDLTHHGLVTIGRIESLEHLVLRGWRYPLSGDQWAPLAQLQSLRSLDLYYTHFDDRAVECLGPLVKLEELRLAYTQVSDASCDQLVRLTNLQVLDVYRTEFTARGVARLRRELPRTIITSSYGDGETE